MKSGLKVGPVYDLVCFDLSLLGLMLKVSACVITVILQINNDATRDRCSIGDCLSCGDTLLC